MMIRFFFNKLNEIFLQLTIRHQFTQICFFRQARCVQMSYTPHQNALRLKQQKVFCFLNHRILVVILVYDSSAKYPGGILFGEVAELGNFDQCMSVSSDEFGIRGAYAVVDLRFQPADSRGSEPLDFVKAHRDRSRVTTLTTNETAKGFTRIITLVYYVL